MYQLYLSRYFIKQLKPLIKKYPHLADDLIIQLKKFRNDTAVPLGHSLYKVRIKSSDLAKGKNKSFRTIVYVLEMHSLLAPIAIYYKGDLENISQSKLEYALSMILTEVRSL